MSTQTRYCMWGSARESADDLDTTLTSILTFTDQGCIYFTYVRRPLQVFSDQVVDHQNTAEAVSFRDDEPSTADTSDIHGSVKDMSFEGQRTKRDCTTEEEVRKHWRRRT